MRKLDETTLIPLGLATTALIAFGGISFSVGGFYNRAVTDSESVKEMKADISQIKSDIDSIKRTIAAKEFASKTQYLTEGKKFE
jgi:hypothetical protein